jgi:hypothetical protein
MSNQEKYVYILSSADVIRIRELLSMLRSIIDCIFDRCETITYPEADEIMADLDFFEKCNHPARHDDGF